MSNPVFERMKDDRGYATFGPTGATKTDAPAQPTYATPSADELQTMYSSPSATTADTGRMTYDDVVVRTAIVFVAVLAGGVVGWQVPALMWPGLIGGLVLGLVNAFKKSPSPALIIAYGLFEGAFLGGISMYFNDAYPGIVAQAVLATLGVFAVVLVGFRSGKLRTSPKLNKIFFIAIGGYIVFGLVNLLLMAFTGTGSMREGGLGLVIGAFAVVLASYSLVMDFEFIKAGVEQGAPEKFAWYGAFGLIVTLVWLYIEILRILSILRN
ncbi:Bax inhibitor-1/YccA family protein [Angustibacter sp. McL0619]|uniref:Bax inhibitor-1/YccA family protein n=1 Tax=Angustibacter sp. McL0619 TaxID=3415676 RepID=UPI003CFAAA4F